VPLATLRQIGQPSSACSRAFAGLAELLVAEAHGQEHKNVTFAHVQAGQGGRELFSHGLSRQPVSDDLKGRLRGRVHAGPGDGLEEPDPPAFFQGANRPPPTSLARYRRPTPAGSANGPIGTIVFAVSIGPLTQVFMQMGFPAA
jgi:hypothetical protein